MKEKFNSIDIFKFVASIIVVAIHTNPFIGCSNDFINNLWSTINIMAVPFFFISTGYLTFYKRTDEEKIDIDLIMNIIRKYVKLYLIWTIIYLPITIYDFIHNDRGIVVNILYFIRGFFLLGENFGSWPLWYILSTIYGFLIIYILSKLKVSKKKIILISIFVLIVSGIITLFCEIEYNFIYPLELLKKIFHLLLGGSGRLFSGFGYICIGIGITLADKKNKFYFYTMYLLGTILFLITFFIPEVYKKIIIIPLIPIIFISVKNFRINNNSIDFKLFRKLSTVTYFTHMIFFFMYTYLIGEVNMKGFRSFIVSLVLTWILGIIVYFNKDKKILKLIF